MLGAPMPPARTRPAEAPRLSDLGAVFARYGNLTFGGGSATIATLREQVLVRRAWISESQFQLAYALSRLTPGTNLLAFCAAVGWTVRRGSGALVALGAASLPCSLLAVVVTRFYELGQTSASFVAALRGALAAAVALMLNTAWGLARPHVRADLGRALVIVPGAIALVTAASLSPLQVLLIAAAAGALWPARETSA